MLTFKKEHPFHYWTRLLLGAWMTVSLIFMGIASSALVEEETDYHYYLERDVVCRDLWGTLWYFYTDNNYALYYEWSFDNGTTWTNKTEFIEEGWEGTTKAYVQDAVITNNNSIVLSLSVYNYNNPQYEQLLLVKYNDTLEWFPIVAYSSLTASYGGQIAINRTNHILICYQFSTYGLTKIYDFDGDTLSAQSTYTSGVSTLRLFPTVNMSNDFWIAWYSPSSIGPANIRDYNKTLSTENVGTYAYITAFGCLDNDVLVLMAMYHYGISDGVNYFYRTGLNTWVTITLSSAGHSDWSYYWGSMSITSTNKISFIANDDVEDRIYGWGPIDYDSTQVQWQATESVFYDDAANDEKIPTSFFGDLYPVKDLNRIDLPLSGVCFGFNSKQAAADYDNYYNSTAVWDDPWLGVEEEPPDDDDDDEETEPLVDIQCVSGALMALVIIIFMMTLAVVVMESAR